MSYKFLDHTADVKFLAEGKTLEDMFVSAMDALNEIIRGNIVILDQVEKVFEVSGRDKENLLYSFLEEFLILLDKDDFLVSSIKSIRVSESDGLWNLKCEVFGDGAENYKFTNDVKAVTYSEMFVREKDDGWECQVVLDV